MHAHIILIKQPLPLSLL